MTPKRRALNLSVIFACLCFSKSLLIKKKKERKKNENNFAQYFVGSFSYNTTIKFIILWILILIASTLPLEKEWWPNGCTLYSGLTVSAGSCPYSFLPCWLTESEAVLKVLIFFSRAWGEVDVCSISSFVWTMFTSGFVMRAWILWT